MRLWFEVNQHKERSIRTFNEKGSEVEIIICQVISITARLIVPFNNIFKKLLKHDTIVGNVPVSHELDKCVPPQVYTYLLSF